MNLNITLVIQGLAFFLVAWLFMKFFWPLIMGAIEERQKKIADGLAAADRAQQELKEADTRVADEIRKARTQATEIVEKAHSQASQIVDKAKADAIAEGNRQKAAAEAEIENLAHRAKEQLRHRVAELAVAGARRIIQREIDANTHKALLDQLVAEI